MGDGAHIFCPQNKISRVSVLKTRTITRTGDWSFKKIKDLSLWSKICDATCAAPRTVIHTPTRGVTVGFTIVPTLYMFQPTPLHEGRLDERKTDNIPLVVSIHAPKGRLRRPWFWISAWCFNPRPYMRGDVTLSSLCVLCILVSIHAPTRGATIISFPQWLRQQGDSLCQC